LLLAFGLRTYALGGQELTFDEVASVYIADRGPFELLTYVTGAVREHPPLYYLLLSLWMSLAGTSEFAVRFLSVIIGIVTVAATFRVLQRASRPSLALLSTLLLVVSPFHVRISRDARMYGLLALWSLLSISAFVDVLEHKREGSRSSPPRFLGPLLSSTGGYSTSRGDALAKWGLFGVVTGLGMFTHYFMVFVILAENLYLVLNWRRFRRLLPTWLAVHAALGGLVALWAVLSPGLWATLISLVNRGVASKVRWQALARALNGLYLGATLRPNWYHLGLCLVVTGLGLLPYKQREPLLSRTAGRDSLLHGLMLGVPIAAVLALPERVSGRYLTPALPASVVAMAVGLDGLFTFLKNRLITVAGARLRMLAACILPLGLLCGVLFVDVRAYSTVYSPSGESFRDKITYLGAHARSEDALLLHGPWQSLLLSYYSAGPLRSYTVPLRDLKIDAGRVDARLNYILKTHERLWVSYGSVEPVDPGWLVSGWLHEHAHQVLDRLGLALYYRSPAQNLPAEVRGHARERAESATEERTSRVFLPLTAHDGDGYERVMRVDIPFGNTLELGGVALSNLELTSGEAVLLLSQWRVLRDIPPGLAMRLELVGPGDAVWEHYQFGVGPARVASRAWQEGDTFIERRGLVVPTGTPPGDYQLRLHVISPDREEWLPQGGQPFEVGVVRVQHHAPLGKETRTLPGQDLHVDFGGAISLIGYAPWGRDFTQGNPILFDIYWQALDVPSEDYELEIEVVRGHGSVLTRKRVQPVADWCPTSSWKAKDVLRGHYAVPLATDAPPGPYQIRLSVIASDGARLLMEGTRTRRILDWWEREETLSGTDLVLFGGRIEARPRRYRPPAMDHRVDVVLSTSEGEPNVRLLGYDLTSTSVEPGGSFELTLYWKAMSRMERIYAVFNHLVAPGGMQLAQQDGWPRQGTYHTNQWLPGEVVEDHYTIEVPLEAPPAGYTLRVGMYDAATGERLLIAVDGTPVPEGYVELATVTVAR
jgi:4-amino-4-deoxy-L-arabinose transferase-like glycosyltransferase